MDSRLKQILANIFGLRESETNTALTKDDVESWDSLKQMDLVVSLEREYDVTLEMYDILKMTDFAGIVEILREKGVEFED